MTLQEITYRGLCLIGAAASISGIAVLAWTAAWCVHHGVRP